MLLFMMLNVTSLTLTRLDVMLLTIVLNSVSLVPSWVSWASYHRATVLSWVRNFFSWVFRRSETFFRGYFVGPIFFSWVISWVQNFFTWKFCGQLVNISVRNEKQTTYSCPNKYRISLLKNNCF